MTNTNGYRRGTRHMFRRAFRKHGTINMTSSSAVYKRGDIVNIKGNGAVQKGMPHKSYHGKTGRVYNVTRRGIGVVVNKRVRGRIIPKKINLRVEHIKHSDSRKDFLERMVKNDKIKRDVKLGLSEYVVLRREPEGPRSGHFVKVKEAPLFLRPLKYELL
ncbi:hypothetical protein A3Q56_04353, partial [Intoshia linei]